MLIGKVFTNLFFLLIFISGIFILISATASAPTNLLFSQNTTSSYDEGNFSINWTAGSADVVNYSIYVYTGGGFFVKADNDSATGYSFNNWTEANYTFIIEAVNSTNNNTNSTSNISMYVDRTAPIITLPAYTNATFKKNTTTLTLNISVSDASSGLTGSICLIDINGTNQSFAVSGGWCNTTQGNLTSLTDGNKTISIYVNDTVNILGLNNSFVVQMDSTNPLIDYGAGTSANNINLSQSNIYVNVSVTETNEDTITFLLWNSTGQVNSTSFTSSVRTINWTNLSNGVYTYNVTINDSAVNSNTTSTRTITLDTINPLVSYGLNVQTNASNVSQNWVLVNASYIESNPSTLTFRIYNSTGTQNTTQYRTTGNTTNITINFTGLLDGDYQYNFTLNDTSGNSNTTSDRYITLDTLFPNINSSSITGAYDNGTYSIISPQRQENKYDNISIDLAYSETINASISIINSTGSVIRTLYSSTSVQNPSAKIWNGTNDSISYVSDGVYTINTTMTDKANNINKTQLLTVYVDNTPPLFQNISINSTPNEIQNVQINVTIIGPNLNKTILEFNGTNYTVSTNSSNEYYYDIKSGNYSAHQVMNYTWYANDSLGNLNKSAEQSFTVANRAPFFNSSRNISALSWVEDSGQESVNLTFSFYELDGDDLNYTAAVNDTNITVSIDNSTGIATLTSATDWNGKANVTFYALDGYDNNLSNIVNITVSGDANEPPVLTSPVSPVNFSEDSNTTFDLICSPGTGESATQNCTNYVYDSSYSSYDSNVSVTVNSTNGTVSLNASADWFGTTYIKFQVNDNGTPVQTDDLVILINVTSVNDLPVMNYSAGTFNQTQIEDYGNWTLNLSVFETDVDSEDEGTNLTWDIGNINTSLINATLNTTTDIITFTTVANANGENLLTINLTDSNNGTTNGTLWVNITSVNDVPSINATIGPFNLWDNSSVTIFDLTGNADDDNDSDTSNLVWDVVNENSSLWTYAGTGTGQTIQFIPNQVVGVNNVTNNVTIVVTDPNNANDTVYVNITIKPVNDAPSTISDTGRTPTNNSNQTSATNLFTLDWVNSTDFENQTLTYYIFFENTTSPSLNGTSSISEYNVSNLADNTTYYWNVITSDSVKNSSASTTWQFTTDFDNIPNITVYEPSTNLTISENQTLEFNATIYDSDGNNMTYNWTIDGVQNLTATTSTNNATITFNYTPSFSDSGTHTIKLSLKDTNNNSGISKSWLITVSNNNRNPVLDAIINYSVSEDSTLTFNITGSDSDSNTLTYSSNLSSITITKTNNTLAGVSFTPTNSNVGINLINFTLSDGTATVYQTMTITVSNTNDAPTITSSSPTSDPLVKNGTSQTFSVSTSDADSDSLTITWYINGTSNGTGSSKSITQKTSKSSEVFNITAIVSDGNTTTLKTWYLTVTSIPVTSTFTGSETTDFSAISDLSSATNIVLAESDGKISFGSQALDLSDVLDLDNNVKISNGIVAINSSKYSQLNKSATITLTGLSYDKVPKIFYNNGFTTTASEITTECSFCNIVSSTDAPTSSGTVVFEVDHFSSFKVGESENEYDLDSFDDLDLCEEGIIGDLELEIEKPDEGDDFQIGDVIKIKAEVDNNADEDKDFIVEASLYNIDEDDEEENVESNDEEINEDDSETFKLEIEVPDDFDDNDDYVIFVKAYEDNEEDTQCDQNAVGISLEREKHDVIIKDATITSQTVYSGNSINVFVDVENVGSKDEDVYVTLENSALEISEKSETFELEEHGDDDFSTQIFFVKIPSDAKEGDYLLNIRVVFDDGSDERTETISVLRTLSLTTGFDGSFTDLKYEGEKEEIIKAKKESKKLGIISSKKLSDDNYLFVYILVFGIIILFLLIIVVLNSRKRFR